MSLLPSATFANPTTSFYAANGGGGGGGSSLQSPATITPDGAGTVSLTAAATGGGTGEFVVSSPAGAASIAIDGIQSSLAVGAAVLTQLNGNQVLLISENENGSNPTVEIDVSTNEVVLCNPAAVSGAITANNPITLNNNTVSGISGLVGVVAGGVTLRNQVPSGGTVIIGSSQGQPSTLLVNEIAGGLGQVVVGGRGVGSGIAMAGGDTEAGASAGAGVITMGTNTGSEKLYLGANGNTPTYKTIELRGTEVLFNLPPVLTASSGPLTSQILPNILKAAGVVSPGTITVDLSLLQTGLWFIVGSSTSPTAGDYAAFFSTTVRMLANSIVSGGCVNGPTNTYNLTVTGAAQLSLQVANATSAAYTILAYPIFLL